MTYIPKPIDTSDVVLSKDILELAELIAKNVHEVWAESRLKEGWKYGEKKDSDLKTNPCLIPYEELPESEKEDGQGLPPNSPAFWTMRVAAFFIDICLIFLATLGLKTLFIFSWFKTWTCVSS